jgi:hypothetical protein
MAVGDGQLAVVPSQRRGVSSALEGFTAGKVTVLPQDIVVGKALIQYGVALAFGHRNQLLLFDLSKADVSHIFLLICALVDLLIFDLRARLSGELLVSFLRSSGIHAGPEVFKLEHLANLDLGLLARHRIGTALDPFDCL